MDYKFLAILALVYSAGVYTSRVMNLVRAAVSGMTQLLGGLKVLDLHIKYERGDTMNIPSQPSHLPAGRDDVALPQKGGGGDGAHEGNLCGCSRNRPIGSLESVDTRETVSSQRALPERADN